MTPAEFDLVLVLIGFLFVLVLGGAFAEMVGPNPLEGERRRWK